MNEFVAATKKDSLAIANNGVVFDLDLTDFDELTIVYKDGVFHYMSGDKKCHILDGYQVGDIMPTGRTNKNSSEHTTTPREFKGRLPGRFNKIPRVLLNSALNEYESVLATKGNRSEVLYKWACAFRVQPSTVGVWMAKHRKTRRVKQQKPCLMQRIRDYRKTHNVGIKEACVAII